MYKTLKIGKIKTSKIELIDIAKAWLAISLAFAFVYSGVNLFRGTIENIASIDFLMVFAVSLVTAGLGFLLHELAHKFVAQYYGCTAEFRAFDTMLYLAMGLALVIGFIFAAPGAVMISGRITRKENGVISVAGPLTNYILALVFLGLSFIFPSLSLVWLTGFHINFWLGAFNLIPFGHFDGLKVLHWNRYVWAGMVAVGVYFLFVF